MKSGNRYIIGLDHGNHLIKTANHIMQNGVKRIGGSIPEGFGNCGLPKGTEKMTAEMASFLAGLNSGG